MDDASKNQSGKNDEKDSGFNALKYSESDGPKDREVLLALSKTVYGLFEGVKIEEGKTALVNIKNRRLLYLSDNVVKPFYKKQAIRN